MTHQSGGPADTMNVTAPSGSEAAHPAAAPVDVAALYLQHRVVMYRAARRVLGPGRAEDVQDAVQAAVEQAFLEVRKAGFVDRTNWAGWLSTVTTRKAIDLWRVNSARRNHEDAAARQDRVSPNCDPVGGAAVARDTVSRLRDAMASLSDDAALMVFLTQVEELSNAEVGRRLGVTGQWVGRVVGESLGTLKATMEEVTDR